MSEPSSSLRVTGCHTTQQHFLFLCPHFPSLSSFNLTLALSWLSLSPWPFGTFNFLSSLTKKSLLLLKRSAAIQHLCHISFLGCCYEDITGTMITWNLVWWTAQGQVQVKLKQSCHTHIPVLHGAAFNMQDATEKTKCCLINKCVLMCVVYNILSDICTFALHSINKHASWTTPFSL